MRAWVVNISILAAASFAVSGCGTMPFLAWNSSPYLRSITNLTETRSAPVAPRSEDQLLIDPATGAAEVLFGQGVDDIVKAWGKPDRISMDMGHVLRLSYLGGLRFTFEGNRLYEIHVQGLPGARFKDGPALDAGMEEIRAFLGNPVSESTEAGGLAMMDYQFSGCSLRVTSLGGRQTAVTLEKR